MIYSFTYDRWGNRTAQTLTAGSSGWHWTGSFNNLTNQATGYSYDIAGNLLNDGSHSYTYDAEGNVLTVDSGATATYVYDVMNRRVSAQTASGTSEFVYDPAGHKMSTWNTVTNQGTDGRIYWGNQQIAYRSGDGTTYFDHQDWLSTERLRTNYQGNAAATYANLAFGDGTTQTATGSGVNQDNNGFTSLELDSLSATHHAQFREYNPGEGRWMSPDPYSGSYDFTNPQSFNRYTYVQNNPAWFTDPSGQLTEGPALYVGTAICGPECGAVAAVGAGIAELLVGLLGFNAPSFHGSLEPRPSAASWDGNFGESLGIPTSIQQGNWGVGLTTDGCEFGACGSGFLNKTQINENKTLQQKIAELEAAGIFFGPFETKHSPFHRGQITLRDTKFLCSQHVTLDQGSGRNGNPVTGESHYDLFNPWASIPLSTQLHTVYDLFPDIIEQRFPWFPTGSDVCKLF